MRFRNVPLLVDWIEGRGFNAFDAPRTAGLYAQIYWPERAVRIGQSSNIRSRLREAVAWADAMKDGTARDGQLRRTSELCLRVKRTGNQGFEYFLITNHHDFSDQYRRLECEAYLFGWFAAFSTPNGWTDWNAERVRKDLKAIYDEGAQAFKGPSAASQLFI